MLRFYGCFAANLLVRGIYNIYKRSSGAVFKISLANYEGFTLKHLKFLIGRHICKRLLSYSTA